MSFWNFWKKKKSVRVLNGKSFIAAYSSLPFEEALNGTPLPNYLFDERDGTYWCFRIGDVEIPWGIDRETFGFGASGCILVSRRAVGAASLTGRGFNFVLEGDVYYLYENQLNEDGFSGFVFDMQQRLIRCIHSIARSSTADTFESAMMHLGDDPTVQQILKEFSVQLKSVTVNSLLRP